MRADKFFAEKFGSRTKSAEALSRGVVLRNGRALKPSDEVRKEDDFFFLTEKEGFVSNGGYKLSRAFEAFRMQTEGKIYADLGASTGGFTDCLLQHGAKHVFCVDVGESLLADTLANDKRVTVMDKTNARYLKKEDFPCQIDGVVSDLSFISLKLVLPAIAEILPDGGEAYLLIKPQFEVGRKSAGKSGIVPKTRHAAVISDIYDCAVSLTLAPTDIVNAPVREKKNIEYVARFQKRGNATEKSRFLMLAQTLYEEFPRA